MKEYKFGDVTVIAVSEKYKKGISPCEGCFFYQNEKATCADPQASIISKISIQDVCLGLDCEIDSNMVNKFKKI